MVKALFHVHRMRGGAQSHLMFCSDRAYYVVKFCNNPQDVRVLANEMLANRLAQQIGLPVPECDIVEVSAELIAGTPELRFEGAREYIACAPGRHFGSRLPVDPTREAVYDFVPDQTLALLTNRQAFAGTLMFDQWTCNTDARQAIFCRDSSAGSEVRYRALMIDQGFCFNDGEWNFPDSPLRGLYARRVVYEGVTGWESFEPWLTRLLSMDWCDAQALAERIPLAWYARDAAALDRLIHELGRRRGRVKELIQGVRQSSRNPFPHWV